MIIEKLKNIIEKVTGRKNFEIEGQNPNLSEWLAWYKGQTSWHTYMSTNSQKQQVFITRKSSGVAKLMCEDWASNYANENTKITVTSDKKINGNEKQSENDLIQVILKKNKVLSRFNIFTEMFMGLGIGATVVMPSKIYYQNNNIIKKDDVDIKVTYITADKIVPITIEDGNCTECAFVKYGTNNCMLQIHLNVDGLYWIVEAKGTKSNGAFIFDDDNISILKTKSNIPFFQIWHPNIQDNKNLDNPLGASIYADCIDSFKCLDIIFDSFFKEFKNGSKKRYVSAELTEIDAEGKLTSYKAEDEEYIIPPGADGRQLIQEFNGELRVESHIKAINFYLNYIAKKCGLGDNRFEFEGSGGRPIQTATGVIAKETALFRNVVKQENFASDCFREMLLAIKYVNNEFTNNITLTYTENDIEIMYDDNIVEDTDSKKKQELAEVQNGIMSLAEFRSHWYDENINTALEFLQSNAMLINNYLPSLQAGAITPAKFVDLVYGAKVPDKDEIIKYIEDKMSFSNSMFNDDYLSEEMKPSKDE